MIINEVGLNGLEAMDRILRACQASSNLSSGLDWDKESIERAMKNSFGKILGVYQLEELVSFVLFKDLSDPSYFNNSSKRFQRLELWCLATAPNFQRMGIMGLLLRELKQRSLEIWLEVHVSNFKAITFYKTEMFQQVGLRPKYYKDGKEALLFSWKS